MKTLKSLRQIHDEEQQEAADEQFKEFMQCLDEWLKQYERSLPWHLRVKNRIEYWTYKFYYFLAGL